ncbi:MAG: SpoIIE family protein phosphatase [Terracidiphilus sp.]
MNLPDPALVLLREHLAGMVAGAIILFVGVIACCVAGVRRHGGSRLLVSFGVFIGGYGLRVIAEATSALHLLPNSPWPDRVVIGVDYLLVIPSLFFWIELSRGPLRRVLWLLIVVSAGIAALGLGWYALGGSPYTFLRYATLTAILMVVVLGLLFLFPAVTQKYLLIQSRPLRFVMPALALLILYVNVMWFFGVPPAPIIEPLAFSAWILAIGYEAARHLFNNERRLLSIESELETAREIQSSTLPDCLPRVDGLRIAATYKPMSAVAGDYYQFLQPNEGQLGVLVADVSGHGVPAALIASMIKVAMQSAAACASEPSQLLRSLNRILTPELRGRLTSAAYLWIDTKRRQALYSAAGHPALLHWIAASGELRRIESNGLLFGVMSECGYPSQGVAFSPGDRFLVYTDGLVEPENARGEPFGDRQLETALETNRALPAAEMSQALLSALGSWQPASVPQQDDITLVVVDAL